ncbi:MAG: sigma-70 family RNA polymerase sigma factor [Planctomycetes bacterium]|nr:sigma-70 family RNA polymerase sigma factor [Planctomycetota bacterium]
MASPEILGNLWSASTRLFSVELLKDPDADLVAACRQPGGEAFEAAFEQLFHRYRERVYAIAFRVTGSSIDALDVVQDSFSLLFRKLSSFRGGSLFSTWLFRIVVNCSIDHRRRRSPMMQAQGTVDNDSDFVDESTGPRATAAKRELGDHVQAAIAELSPKLRAILALRYLENMSYDELAATLSLSLGTVKSRLARAHIALEVVVRTRYPHLKLDEMVTDSRGDVG